MKTAKFLLLFLATSCVSTYSEENWALLINYSPVVKYDSGPVLQFDSEVNKSGIYLLEMAESGVCNPLCPGICRNNICFESVIDDAFLNDATDGELSESRRKVTIPLKIEPVENTVLIKPETGTLRPGAIYELLLTPLLRSSDGYPVKYFYGDQVPFTVSFQTEEEDLKIAEIKSVWPADGAEMVPQNSAWILIESNSLSSGIIKSGDLYIESEKGEIIELSPDDKTRLCSTECLLLWIDEILESETVYYLKSRNNLSFKDGSIIPSWKAISKFKTGKLLWSWDPAFSEVESHNVTGCTHFNTTVNSDVLVWMRNEEGFAGPVIAFSRGEIEMGTRDTGRIEIYYIGINGVSGKLGRFDTDPEISWNPTLAITELYPNAIGGEPAMEYIAIKNISFFDLNLLNYRLTDDLEKPGETLPELILSAGSTIYITGENYDFMEPEAVLLEDKNILITDGSLLSSGMTNSGETIWLIDPSENIVSRYGGWIDVSETPGVIITRIDPHGCDVADRWTIIEP